MARDRMVSKAPASYRRRNSQRKAEDIKRFMSDNPKYADSFAKMEASLRLLDNIQKARTNAISAFSKEKLRNYLKNIGSNERNLRELSRYLYWRSQPYKRFIQYNSTMIDLSARTVIPTGYSLVKTNNPKKLLKAYNDTLDILDKLNLNFEMRKAYTNCFIEDVFYGCVYYDETGFTILQLDPNYCKLGGFYQSGDFGFYMDMSYFTGSRNELLELWGEPFQSMYNAYLKDTTNGKFQPMPDENCICLKADPHDWKTIAPPFSGLLNSVISLIDLEDIQAIADKQDILKVVALEMETQDGAKEQDRWKVDPDIYIEYFDRLLNDCLPDYVAGAIVPGKLSTISFKESDKINDTNKMSKATQALFNSSGGAQILNSSTISGTEAFKSAVLSDTQAAISMLLPQTEAWLNRWLTYQIANPAKVKFFPVSVYTKEAYKESLRLDAEVSMPVKLALNTFNGYSEKDTLAMLYLEEEILGLSQALAPLQSSHTTSGTNPAATKALTNGGDASGNNKADSGE